MGHWLWKGEVNGCRNHQAICHAIILYFFYSPLDLFAELEIKKKKKEFFCLLLLYCHYSSMISSIRIFLMMESTC
jgi:hypothetical protein